MARALKRFLISQSLQNVRSLDRQGRAVVRLNASETHHLRHVLRMRAGAMCLLVDPKGNEYIGRVESFLGDATSEARVLLERSAPQATQTELAVAQAIPQKRKMDWIVEKAAELGVATLIPLITERTVVRVDPGRREKVRERWSRIAQQAIKQSGLWRAPEVNEITEFGSIWQGAFQSTLKFIFHPSREAKSIGEVIAAQKNRWEEFKKQGVLLVIGPEGGFSETEIGCARNNGAEVVNLKMPILKSDTAFVAIVSCFRMVSS